MTNTTKNPKWVAFEGCDGSGKSTQAARAATLLGATLTREPGGTSVGTDIRQILLNSPTPVDPITEMLLFAADRAQHVADVIRPAFARGRHVVADRSVWSSFAYQHGGRGIDANSVLMVNAIATSAMWPDFVVYNDIDPVDARARSRRGEFRDGEFDNIEREGLELQFKVRETFLELAAANPDTWLVVDATRSVDDVGNIISDWLNCKLGSIVEVSV